MAGFSLFGIKCKKNRSRSCYDLYHYSGLSGNTGINKINSIFAGGTDPNKALIEILYERYFNRIYRYFYYKYFSKEIAEDLTSDTFFRFVSKAKERWPDNEQSYLFGIAYRIHLEYLRHKYHHSTIDLDENMAENIPELESDTTDKRKASRMQRLWSCVEKLPDKQRNIVELILHESLGSEELAKKLHTNINYVKTTRKRAVRNLKRLLACTP